MNKTSFELKTGVYVAVDFDGTCVTHEYPEVGRDIGAIPVLHRIAATGAKLILWTMRSGDKLADAVRWFEEAGLHLYGVNRNPSQDWSDSPKAYAHLYIDDAALGAPLVPGEGDERPHIDWVAVEQQLFGDVLRVGEWEIFCDPSYYHMWCVRRTSQRRFGEGFHVPTEEEAEALKSLLTHAEQFVSAASRRPTSN